MASPSAAGLTCSARDTLSDGCIPRVWREFAIRDDLATLSTGAWSNFVDEIVTRCADWQYIYLIPLRLFVFAQVGAYRCTNQKEIEIRFDFGTIPSDKGIPLITTYSTSSSG